MSNNRFTMDLHQHTSLVHDGVEVEFNDHFLRPWVCMQVNKYASMSMCACVCVCARTCVWVYFQCVYVYVNV